MADQIGLAGAIFGVWIAAAKRQEERPVLPAAHRDPCFDLYRAGLCRRCHRRDRLSREKFGGQREEILARDGHQCQICGEVDPLKILVHHRPRGLITLCRACHVRIHRTWRPSFLFASFELLRRLWREVNADLAEQRLLALIGEKAAERERQAGLFEP